MSGINLKESICWNCRHSSGTPYDDYVCPWDKEGRAVQGTISDAIKMLGSDAYTPTIDDVPVVRCKDCKHFENAIDWCKIHSHFSDGEWNSFSESDYCSWGERKDDAE